MGFEIASDELPDRPFSNSALRTPHSALSYCLLLILTYQPIRAADTTVDDVRRLLTEAEASQMMGHQRETMALYREALERIAEVASERRVELLPEADLILGRLYKLASVSGEYKTLEPIFEKWAAFGGDDAPAAAEPCLAARARFYAGAARAYSNDNLENARELWAPLGFLSQWSIIGPFDNERGGGFATSYGPEQDRLPDPEIIHEGKKRSVSWRTLPVRPITGWVNLDPLMRPDDQVLAYALSFIYAENAAEACLRLGTDEGYRLWVNGRLVASKDLHRLMRFDQDAIGVRLRKGWNSVLLKVAEDDGRWEFRARLTRPDGGPLGGWREDLPPADADLPPPPQEADQGATNNRTNITSRVRLGTRDLLKSRLEAEADSAHLHYLLGAILQERGAHDVLEHPEREALERAVQLHSDPVPAIYHYLLAEAHRRRRGVAADRDENSWRESMERAAQGTPPSIVALVRLGSYYLETFGNLERARELLQQALGANPDFFEARLLMGELESRLHFPRSMEKAYEECLRRGSSLSKVIRYRADQLLRAGAVDDAEELLRNLLARDRSVQRNRDTLVELLLGRNRRGEAVSLLERSLELHPFDIENRRRQVAIHRGAQDFEASLEVQRELVRLAPDDHELHGELGKTLWRLGRRDEAFAAWEVALDLQPNFPTLREYVDFLKSRPDPFVEEFRRDVTSLVERARQSKIQDRDDDPAETLLDLAVVNVEVDGMVKEFHQEIHRILNDHGVRMYDQFRTYYAAGNQRVEFRVARVVHRDGSEERARIGVFSGGRRDSGGYRSATVDLPPVERGDIVEVQYVREDLFPSFFGDYFGHREYFQHTLPVSEKTFILRVPGSRKFYFHYRNLDLAPKIDRQPENDSVTYSWTRHDIAKMKPEPKMPPRQEDFPALEVSTFENWEAFSQWYWNLIRKQYESSPDIVAKVGELTSGAASNLEKIRALYNFVVQEVRYNAWEFGVHGFKPYNTPTIFARRFGDCKDKANLLSMMLKEVNIPSYPVLIYATPSRWEEDLTLPMVNHFNHCITYVPKGEGYGEMFLDGTAQHNRLEELPSADSGARVLVVRPQGSSLERVPWNLPTELSVQEDVQVDLKEDGSAELEIRGLATGDLGASLRRFFEVPGKRQRDLERLLGKRFAGVSVEEEEFSELAVLKDPVSFRLRLQVPKLVHQAAEGLSMEPLDDFFETSQIFSGLSSLETRRFDLLLGAPRQSLLNVTVHLPPGLRVKSLPAGRSLANRFSRLEVEVSTDGNKINFRRLLEVTSHRVKKQEYAHFRELATALKRMGEEKWVLERVESFDE